MSQETEYLVRDEGGNVFGPATMAVLRRWIGEGRITPTMEIGTRETGPFTAAGQIPELHEALGRGGMPGSGPGPGTAVATAGQGGGSGGPLYGQAGLDYRPAPLTHPLAITSLVIALVGIPVCPPVMEILAVVFGHIARRQIRNDPAHYSGDGLAQAGLIIGYIVLGLTALLVAAYALLIIFMVVAGGAMR